MRDSSRRLLRLPRFERAWGHATALFQQPRAIGWVDVLVLAGFAGVVFGALDVLGQWSAPLRLTAPIDLSPWALPNAALHSLSRGIIAYAFSLLFTLAYGTWAARDASARRILLPLLDVLQSVPVLGFMPGVVLTLVALFPHRNAGLELASILLIFTGQAWNMTFSFYHSLRTVPADLLEASRVYRFTAWQRFRWVEMPFATSALVWNSMMSMAGGWFFLMISEAFVLGNRDYRLPGLGSYMSVAAAKGDTRAMLAAIVTMMLMIVALDQFLWRPVVVWARRFRVEEGAGESEGSSWFLDWLRRSRLLRLAGEALEALRRPREAMASTAVPRAGTSVAFALHEPIPRRRVAEEGTHPIAWHSWLSMVLLLLVLGAGAAKLVHLLRNVSWRDWVAMVVASAWTLSRVLCAVAVGTLWALPAGLAIGTSQRLSRLLQPVVQVAASFPAPMLFPAAIAAMQLARIPIGWGAVVLMLLGTQWYVLFNVIAGAQSIPGDLREAADSYRLSGWRRFFALQGPAVFPYLVTGWVTAAGGAWNASIVSEYVSFRGSTLVANGVGSRITQAAERGDLPHLAAGVLVLCAFVVTFNRLVWRRCYRLAEERFSLQR
ncbi:MAG: ABC transporter permease subunit [Candidatus Eisenbacteria bacterium]|uniref:ABC transporter permease subunit n=1 Tax=Eiseniibacteriota bacterium TaxID=2212470 RepID=A0A933W717_UNCEI|nr:ABC transporter permease subunit [Candidatus Eisenbacteria bacterium]